MKSLSSGSGFQSPGMVVIPPPSPSDTNPPLGPAVLARVAEQQGVHLSVVDLNIAYVNRFRDTARRRPSHALGDHGKDRALVQAAARELFSCFGLAQERPLFLPTGEQPIAGMHYAFDTLDRCLTQVASEGALSAWLEETLFGRPDWPPRVFGVSLMGPSQVFVGLLLLQLVKQRHPEIVTVVGGSHVTLLGQSMHTDARYRRHIDVVLPGHCEDAFVRLLRNPDETPGRVGRHPSTTARPHGKTVLPSEPAFAYTPLFTSAQLALYPQDRLTLPVQFTRGCVYGRCTFCTYPQVEPETTDLYENPAVDALAELTETHGIRRFSLKDSLLTSVMMERLARALLARRQAVEWSATTKVTRRLTHSAALLAESGLRTVELGVETVSPRGQLLIDKRARLADIEAVVTALTGQGIVVVVNLIFGLPGETLEEADHQLHWLKDMQRATGGRIDFSLNMLQIVRGSPLAARPGAAPLLGIAPWAYSYAWERPDWVTQFADRIADLELADPVRPEKPSDAG
ncbi:B12-binding domain-containing radical SAM protein [Streptomyces sp. NBC_00557]|uniref:B12-binding domain-containing radical SAM protein n=1 Tax=Streptomyces sp. NBC_00557 TaxID=2975776 RepID=UPI002E8157D4|nr:B12-binding domain-containing radical SAM protein [Streptomyces sp. NBC_00557]WUC33388.1 radical SAM protein [Streptomyces sp. NBC_00557]